MERRDPSYETARWKGGKSMGGTNPDTLSGAAIMVSREPAK